VTTPRARSCIPSQRGTREAPLGNDPPPFPVHALSHPQPATRPARCTPPRLPRLTSAAALPVPAERDAKPPGQVVVVECGGAAEELACVG
jgi:hypothetical protein